MSVWLFFLRHTLPANPSLSKSFLLVIGKYTYGGVRSSLNCLFRCSTFYFFQFNQKQRLSRR